MDYCVINSIKKTEVFDTYWKYAAERQNIFMKRVYGKKYPWTNDKILLNHRFTNVYRASDKVSQFLIKNVIYSFQGNEEDMLFRILLFKTFNKIETWNYLEKTVGEIKYEKNFFSYYSSVLNKLYLSNETLYSGAYIMCSGKKEFGMQRKYENHLLLLDYMFKDRFAIKAKKCTSLKSLFELLSSYPTIGIFLAQQYATDINYSNICNFDENEFVIAGPGAKSGIKKCFSNIGTYSEFDIIKYMVDNQKQEFKKRNLTFCNLWGRDLKLIDCQNIFCETDKYARLAHPNIKGLGNRTRIKQKYTYTPEKKKIELFFPPKWGITNIY